MTKKLLIGIIVVIILFAGLFIWQNIQVPREVKIATDKTEYNQEETLQITIKNDLMKNICFSSCYPYYLEKKNGSTGSPQDGEWKSYRYGECNEDNVIGKCIDSGKAKIFEVLLSSVEKGVHRIAVPVCQDCKVGQEFKEIERFYSNEFTIKEKEVDISDWKTYRNKEIKLEIKHPSDWEIQEEPLNVDFLKKYSKDSDKLNCTFKISMVPSDLLDQTLELHKYMKAEDWRKKEIILNGIPTTKISYPEFPITARYFLKREERVYYLILHDATKTTLDEKGHEVVVKEHIFDPECMNIFSQMLSTFKFIE